MRLRHSLLAGVTAFSVAVSGQPAFAWKPKTHVYLAEEALRDALDNGKVTIYETDQASGKILGPLGEFDVDPKILAALRAAPAQFRAGVLGPDAYPDILTGQQIIHPDEALPHDGSASGTDAWLAHIWKRGFIEGATPQVQAFAIGYLTHGRRLRPHLRQPLLGRRIPAGPGPDQRGQAPGAGRLYRQAHAPGGQRRLHPHAHRRRPSQPAQARRPGPRSRCEQRSNHL